MPLLFLDRRTEDACLAGSAKGIPDAVARYAPYVYLGARRVRSPEALKALRSLRAKKLRGSKPARFMVHIYAGYWLTFRWSDGKAVEFKIEKFQR